MEHHLLLAFQNALLFNVTTNTRLIYAELEEGNRLITHVYLDLEPTEDERDVYYAVAAEVKGDFANLDDGNSRVIFYTEPFSEDQLRGKMVVFARCDLLDENRNLLEEEDHEAAAPASDQNELTNWIDEFAQPFGAQKKDPRQVKALWILGQGYSWLPGSLAAMTELTHVEIYCQFGTELFALLDTLPRLDTLVIKGGIDVPEGLAQLNQLKSLTIVADFEKTPSEVEALTELKFLELRSLSWRDISPGIGQLKKLEQLHLEGDFQSIPPELGYLTELQTLRISSEELLPSSFKGHKKLENIQWYYCPQASVSAQEADEFRDLIMSWENLVALDIRLSEGLGQLEWIGKMTRLKFLKLFGNFYETLPEWLHDLKNLTKLLIVEGPLSQLPNWFYEMNHLEGVSFVNNKITGISPQIKMLTNLSIMELSGNPIAAPDLQLVNQVLERNKMDKEGS